MLLEKRTDDDLLVYLFHDQGLAGFKGLQGFIGSNITLGLPYPRLSPDHGTSFGLFGRNQADYRGCEYSLRQAITLKKKVSHGKDPGHKGKSS
jgi:4-hydroxythreonine-4-phosphate dehydrogenase